MGGPRTELRQTKESATPFAPAASPPAPAVAPPAPAASPPAPTVFPFAPAVFPFAPAIFPFDSFWQTASYVAVAITAIVVYEVLRSIVKSRLRKRFERNLREFLHTPDLYQQRFKFTNRLVIKHQLLADEEINRKIIEFSNREGMDIEAVRDKVDGYIDEIVPSFNILTYFKVGYPIARTIVHSLYDPVVDQAKRRLMEELPPDASPVFVMNHRSNFDFVLLSYILAGKVSISYAVGEWARVWPLEHLFKAFGSYFVRRGYKEDLYHKVLERYVQLIAVHGVTQAIFPEGGLSRDGSMMPAKLGLIGWLSKVEADRDFKRDLVFVPVGVNYDWVIEDENLIKEARGIRKETGFWKKAYVILVGPFMLLGLLFANLFRFAIGRRKLHGYSSLSFAEPISLGDWMADRGVEFGACTPEERRPLIEQFGKALTKRVGEAVPATPVPLVAISMLDNPQEDYSFQELTSLALQTRQQLEASGVRVVVGSTFEKFRHQRREHRDARAEGDKPSELDDIGEAFVQHEETEAMVHFALDVMRRHKLISKRKRRYSVPSNRLDYLRYYANSLSHRLGRSYPIGAAGPEDALAPRAEKVAGKRGVKAAKTAAAKPAQKKAQPASKKAAKRPAKKTSKKPNKKAGGKPAKKPTKKSAKKPSTKAPK